MLLYLAAALFAAVVGVRRISHEDDAPQEKRAHLTGRSVCEALAAFLVFLTLFERKRRLPKLLLGLVTAGLSVDSWCEANPSVTDADSGINPCAYQYNEVELSQPAYRDPEARSSSVELPAGAAFTRL